jgi:lipid-A-disaccharide synthase
MLHVALTAGEASGDALGARLMAALKRRVAGDVRFSGVGGPLMAAEGLDSLFPMAELSVMGLAEILPRAGHLLGRIEQTAGALREARPDVLVTIDSPGFNLRLAGRLKGRSFPLVHYVAPQVWAWRPGRARKLPGLIDRLLALLPFEPEFFAGAGVDCRFVGHPVVESGAGRSDPARFRATHALGSAPLLVVLPGSRRSEVQRHLAIFRETAARLREQWPDLACAIPAAPAVVGEVASAALRWPGPAIVIGSVEAKFDAFAAANAALAASGTVALELALSSCPAAIAYRAHPITAAIVRRLIRVKRVSLANLLLDEDLQPELLQENCRPELLASALSPMLTAPHRAAEPAERLRRLLGGDGEPPSERAAAAVLETAGWRSQGGD